MDGQTDKQTERDTEKQTADRQKERQAEREKQTDRQTNETKTERLRDRLTGWFVFFLVKQQDEVSGVNLKALNLQADRESWRLSTGMKLQTKRQTYR
jgi:hypothetical protein